MNAVVILLLSSALIAGETVKLSYAMFFSAFGILLYFGGATRVRFQPIIFGIVAAFIATVAVDGDFLLTAMYVSALFVICSFNISANAEVLKKFSRIHLTYGFILFFETIIFNGTPISTELICLYGHRAADACYVPSYFVNDVAFPRIYGLASEPASYAVFLVMNMMIFRESKTAEVGLLVSVMLAALVLTFSLLGYLAFAVACLLDRKLFELTTAPLRNFARWLTSRRRHDLLKRVTAVVAIGVVTAFTIRYIDVVSARTIGRLSDFSGAQDRSAILRTTATWLPVYEIYQSSWRGLGLLKPDDFIEEQSYSVIYNNAALEVAGQKSSALAYLMVSLGAGGSLLFVVLSATLWPFRRVALFLLLVFCTSYPLSAVPFVMSLVAFRGIRLLRGDSPKLGLRRDQ